MNKRISDSFDSFERELDLADDLSVDPELIKKMTMNKIRRSGTARIVPRKVWRTLLIAAVVTCFMSVTAFAAAYYHMSYRLAGPGEEQIYKLSTYDYAADDWGPAREHTYTASMILRFDSGPDGYRYYLHADWLPSEPAEENSFYDELLTQAIQELDIRDYVGVELTPEIEAKAAELAQGNWASVEEAKEAHRYEELLVQALDELGIDRHGERYVPPELEERISQLAAGYGITAQEAKAWLRRYSADDGQDIPYLINISDSSDVYNRDYLVGHHGGSVEVVSGHDTEDWQDLSLTVDDTATYGEEDALAHVNHVFRYNKAEGYLIHVSGTLDLDTLGRIAENIRVWNSGIETHYEPVSGNVASVDLGRG